MYFQANCCVLRQGMLTIGKKTTTKKLEYFDNVAVHISQCIMISVFCNWLDEIYLYLIVP